LGGWPEGAASANWHRISPSLNADHIQAPLLVNAADTEYVAGLDLIVSLEQLHKPVEMFIYPNELHVKNQPKHRYEIYERNLDWFKFWLKGEENSNPSRAEQDARWRELRRVQAQKVPTS
jgi:dipeptidyl aminopeptidase/acylaminoacyl peptidase